MAMLVNVIQGERFETFNNCTTVADALKKFGAADNATFRVNGRSVDRASALREGDTISVFSSAVASGGLKGA